MGKGKNEIWDWEEETRVERVKRAERGEVGRRESRKKVGRGEGSSAGGPGGGQQPGKGPPQVPQMSQSGREKSLGPHLLFCRGL